MKNFLRLSHLYLNDFFVSFRFCGGTVISPYHILTAAHCLKKSSNLGIDLKPMDIIVKLGYTSQPFDPKGHDYKVKRISIHPNFTISGNTGYGV